MDRKLDAAATGSLPLWRESLAGLDWLALHTSRVYAGHGIERGDGAPVVLVPGFMAHDATLFELHAWLKRNGYRPYFSGIGLNAEKSTPMLDHLRETIDRAHSDTGRRVTLIGHSLGGLLARGAAIRCSSKVERVITLGSPVNGVGAHPLVELAAELVHGADAAACIAELQAQLPTTIAETNIFSTSDGVVDWRICTRDDAESVEVRGTHIGMIWNPAVYRAIAATLAAPTANVARARHRTALVTVASVASRIRAAA